MIVLTIGFYGVCSIKDNIHMGAWKGDSIAVWHINLHIIESKGIVLPCEAFIFPIGVGVINSCRRTVGWWISGFKNPVLW